MEDAKKIILLAFVLSFLLFCKNKTNVRAKTIEVLQIDLNQNNYFGGKITMKILYP